MPLIDKTRAAVRQRLVQQINYLDAEAARLRDTEHTGRPGRPRKNRQSPDRLEARARDLEARLDRRTAQLDAEAQLAASPPKVVGAALLTIPAGLIPGDVATHARETARIERRAVDAVLAAERALGQIRWRCRTTTPATTSTPPPPTASRCSSKSRAASPGPRM